MIKLLIIGGGGREHALAWKAAQSACVDTVFVAPGNGGTGDPFQNIPIEATDIEGLLAFAEKEDVGLTIVGPEAPLALGIVDRFQVANRLCFGPSQKAAQLEASKAFSKDFMQRHHIPTAAYAVFEDRAQAVAYLDTQSFPLVIKMDGLAAGKGVVIAEDRAQAEATLAIMLPDGKVGHRVVIEEFLVGEEVSFMVVADGQHSLALASSQDHKARDNGDKGPNTGGMGAYSPAPVLTDALEKQVMEQVIAPTLQGMAEEGAVYTGFLYAGLMITPQGDIKVLEFNCRLGDPETQVLMMRLKTDLVNLCLAAAKGELDTIEAIDWDKRPALGVVLASGGYPAAYEKGKPIRGLDQPLPSDIAVFHAGTAKDDEVYVTAGGRVMCITALGEDLKAAQEKAYAWVKTIQWEGVHYRTDIGHKGIDASV